MGSVLLPKTWKTCHNTPTSYVRCYISNLSQRNLIRHQIAELVKRKWTRSDIEGLTNKNLLRVMRGAEAVAKKLQASGLEPSYEIYSKRTDVGRRREL